MADTPFDPPYLNTTCTRKLYGSMFSRTGVIADRSFTLRYWGFSTFLLLWANLDSITFVYELDPYSLKIYQMDKCELSASRFSKVIVWQTDRQTDRHDRNTTPFGARGLERTLLYVCVDVCSCQSSGWRSNLFNTEYSLTKLTSGATVCLQIHFIQF